MHLPSSYALFFGAQVMPSLLLFKMWLSQDTLYTLSKFDFPKNENLGMKCSWLVKNLQGLFDLWSSEFRAPIHLADERLTARSREASKSRDSSLDFSNRSEIRQTHQMPVKFQSDAIIMTYNLAASWLHEILRWDIRPLSEYVQERIWNGCSTFDTPWIMNKQFAMIDIPIMGIIWFLFDKIGTCTRKVQHLLSEKPWLYSLH